MLEESKEQFESVLESIQIIQNRFSAIKVAADFIKSENGTLVLDSISMRLQYIGELIKNIDKTNRSILEKYNEIEWGEIMKLRDVISHHYDDIDYEEVYFICSENLPQLREVVERIIKEK
jgi:uncharacterized protein with HEPN domain